MNAPAPEELDRWMTAARDDDSREAYTRIVEGCHHMVRAVVLRDTADPELADEVAQEVFVRGWVRREQYRPGTNVRAWLLTIARHQILDFRRRQSRDQRHLQALIRKELLRHRARETRESRERQARRRETLEACLTELSDEQRHLLDLVHGQGLTTQAAAEILAIKPATCRKRLSRLQRSLQDCARQKMEAS